ncbi:MAG TPA: DUF4398 domain-containing protein [Syntrophales bacterium]|nr:DUF4398 domain-containing protein [Syntrophales bacterium]
MQKNMVLRYVLTGVAAFGLCLVTGCAATDTVSSRFPKLEENIIAAKAVDAEVYAPAPLMSAEAKLAEARAEVQAGNMVAANKLVDEAMADADYARALAPTEKAKGDAIGLRESIEALREEISKMPPVK